MSGKTIIVTGAFGFSGLHLLKQLLAAGYEVIGTDLAANLDKPVRNSIAAAVGLDTHHPNLRLQAADLLDSKSLEFIPAAKPAAVCHVASLYDYSASLQLLNRVNVDGTATLLEAIRKCDAQPRLLHWSTNGIFGKPIASGPSANLPFSEKSSSPKNTPREATGPVGTRLVNDYSISKWTQEKLVWDYAGSGKPVTIIRPAPIYGPGSDYGHGGIMIAIAKGYLPAIPEDAKNAITTSVHVEDLARFALFALENPEVTGGEDYNIVDNSIISYHEFLHYIALLCGRKMADLPGLPMDVLRPVAESIAKGWTYLEKEYGIPRVRILEIQSAAYIGSSYWLSQPKKA